MDFWEKVRKDLQKGWKEGVEAFKEGAIVVRKKAEELTEEGKKKYKIYDLKTKVHKEISELGGRVYDLRSKVKNPMDNDKIKEVISRLKRLESQITKLEGKKKVTSKRKPAKRTVKAKKK
jgi:hypothetical protein